MFSAQTYIQRRHALRAQLNGGVILLLGNEDSSMNYQHNIYPFRQDSSFLYYFGLDQVHLAGWIDIDSGEEILFGDELTLDDIIWTGPLPALKAQAEQVGVSQTSPYASLSKKLREAIALRRTIHFLPPYRPINQHKIAAWFEIPYASVPDHVSMPLIHAVIAQRSIKSVEEIEQMEMAVNTTRKMHIAAMQNARVGMIEAELAGLVEGLAISGGGRLAYPVIMTVNGQTLHNHHHHNTLKSGQLVLGDYGAENEMHYAGDITRTFPVDSTFTTRQKEIYELVLQAEEAAIAALRPGIAYQQVHLMVARLLTEGLKGLGLMQGDTDESVAAGAYALFMPHGLGHMIGLDVHDMEDLGEDHVGYSATVERSRQFGLSALRLGRELEAGFVLTVEPGLYFIPELIDRWKAEGRHQAFLNYERIETYKDFSGIRIEDNVLVTEQGYRVLGDPIPKTVAEVEALRQA